jgi:Domain of unknown function (DUF4142)
MDEVLNSVARFILIFSILGLSISCERLSRDARADLSQIATGDRKKELVTNTMDKTYQLITLSEMAQHKGGDHISSIAEALKNQQVLMLYLLTDYANATSIALPTSESSNELASELDELSKEQFDGQWQQKMSDQYKKLIENFELASERNNDAVTREMIGQIITVLQSQYRIVNTHYVVEAGSSVSLD